MLIIEASDALLINRIKRTALLSWLAAFVSGVASMGARYLSYDLAANLLLAVVWLAGATFALSILLLLFCIVVALFSSLGRRDNGA